MENSILSSRLSPALKKIQTFFPLFSSNLSLFLARSLSASQFDYLSQRMSCKRQTRSMTSSSSMPNGDSTSERRKKQQLDEESQLNGGASDSSSCKVVSSSKNLKSKKEIVDEPVVTFIADSSHFKKLEEELESELQMHVEASPSSLPRLSSSSKKLKSKKESNKEPAVTYTPSKRLKKEELEKGSQLAGGASDSPLSKVVSSSKQLKSRKESDEEPNARFTRDPVPVLEARQRWPHRYNEKAKKKVAQTQRDVDDEIIQAKFHYVQAKVDDEIFYDLHNDAHVKAGEGEDDYICKIIEMFEAIDGKRFFTAQWYYRARDTVIKEHAHHIDSKRVFFSEIKDDNPLECLIKKLNIAKLPLNADLNAKKSPPVCDYYCDMLYMLPYSSFTKLPLDNKRVGSETSSTISTEVDMNGTSEVNSEVRDVSEIADRHKHDVTLLDLYSGCGAMSTGLCLGANLSGLNLVTRWAVDFNEHACKSLQQNHPETEVRNESAEDFLALLKEWEQLCQYFSLIKSHEQQGKYFDLFNVENEEDNDNDTESNDDIKEDSKIFEVGKILAICFGDPKENQKRGLYLKVRWKGYGANEDTWEPIEGLTNCGKTIKDFVTNGHKSKILPLPGDVHVICGGPPCQGVSGFNRFRNKESPLEDEKNKQLLVFMDLVAYLKPKFVLMENVVDILKFAHGYLGRYALSRLVAMNYQVRMGIMAAGSYGLPQFRLRVFLWGAQPEEKLPQYPLPTHDVVLRGGVIAEFETNTVAYDEGHKVKLKRKLLLEDAISDLPAVGTYEQRDEVAYDEAPQTEFQRFIRLRKEELLGSSPKSKPSEYMLYDHRSLELNSDDYQRVCQIPKRKGANFRDLPGVLVRPDNKVEWDPDTERVYLDSGKPLVPDYAMSFKHGSSTKPFARLWWDETVPTVVTRAEPHNQAILHPEQDRVLSIRENARLQGFPDYYKLSGPVKERYIQVGNAVAVPVARALGYALGLACQGLASDEPLFTLPNNFPLLNERHSSASSEDDA